MKNLIYKEFRLASHPAAFIFLLLAGMMCTPNYPLTVTFFYPCLGAFFICQNSRENRDVFYTAMLPVHKRDTVKARIAFISILQILQIVLCLPFIFLRSLYPPVGNVVGMDANLALLGVGLIQMGIFNVIFFPKHYKNVAKIGVPFVLGVTVVFVFMMIAELTPHVVPFVRDKLDTPLFTCVPEKAVTFIIGAGIYALLTTIACKVSCDRFEKQDLN